MSKADEIIVDFNLVKREINNNDVKPKAKRASKKNNIVVEDVNPEISDIKTEISDGEKSKAFSLPVEEVIKPKPKRTSKKNNIIVEDIKTVEPVEEVIKPKAKRTSKKIIL